MGMLAQHGSNQIALETIRLRKKGKLPMLPMSETTTSPNPQSSILICEKGADKVVGESIGGGIGLDLLAAQMIESIRCTYPERTILIWSQRKDEIAEQAILRGQMAGLAAFIAKKAVIL